jgi:hypothetical protein
MHLHVKEGEDTGPMLSVHIGTRKKLMVKCSCPVEAWNAIKSSVNGKPSKPESRFAELFGLSHTQVLEKLVVRSLFNWLHVISSEVLQQIRIDPYIPVLLI